MDELILTAFGQHLKNIRLGQSISQEVLAERCELDRTYISSIERGKRNVSLLNIIKIANALQITPSEFINFTWDSHNE